MDLAKIEELIEVVRGADISELTLRRQGSSVTIKKGAQGARPVVHHHAPEKESTALPQEEPGAPPAETEEVVLITAPMVGIFHPAEAAFKVGSAVRAGQALGAIESMKLMNEVVTDVGGVVTEVAVEEGSPVQYGQTLFRLKPVEVEQE